MYRQVPGDIPFPDPRPQPQLSHSGHQLHLARPRLYPDSVRHLLPAHRRLALERQALDPVRPRLPVKVLRERVLRGRGLSHVLHDPAVFPHRLLHSDWRKSVEAERVWDQRLESREEHQQVQDPHSAHAHRCNGYLRPVMAAALQYPDVLVFRTRGDCLRVVTADAVHQFQTDRPVARLGQQLRESFHLLLLQRPVPPRHFNDF